MTLPDKATLMAWCRVDDEEAGAVLEQLCAQAAAYLSAAGVLPPEEDPRAELALKALTLHWFDNPAGGDIPAGLQRLINQLKHT